MDEDEVLAEVQKKLRKKDKSKRRRHCCPQRCLGIFWECFRFTLQNMPLWGLWPSTNTPQRWPTLEKSVVSQEHVECFLSNSGEDRLIICTARKHYLVTMRQLLWLNVRISNSTSNIHM